MPPVGQKPPPGRRNGLHTLDPSSTRCASRPSGRCKHRHRPPRHRRRPRCSSRHRSPRRPSWSSARRGYGRRWKPRRQNARQERARPQQNVGDSTIPSTGVGDSTSPVHPRVCGERRIHPEKDAIGRRFIPACGPARWPKRSVGRIWPSRTPRRRRPQAWGDQVTCQWPGDQVTALHPGQRWGPVCRRSTATRSGAGGDLSVAQTPHLGQTSWSSARRGYGRRCKPRRRNARAGKGAAGNCATSCKIIKCKRSHHE